MLAAGLVRSFAPDAEFCPILGLSCRAFEVRHDSGATFGFRVEGPDGAFLVAVPFYFHIHACPYDYWRFTPDAFRLLLEDYPAKIIGWCGPATRPANVWCLAFREKRPPITAAHRS